MDISLISLSFKFFQFEVSHKICFAFSNQYCNIVSHSHLFMLYDVFVFVAIFQINPSYLRSWVPVASKRSEQRRAHSRQKVLLSVIEQQLLTDARADDTQHEKTV